ncbi:Quinol monooxygenase YgiN [Arthrobacter sp. cf158]|uniref:putative quinol monooxygenase n=1 Tax=Arthrobacter sp. cf158 TaxID=1761744 RepID=UPI00089C53FC|nr:putative quinol monooxygenase [Arthrobacter sp. cf158]SDW91568.1 Quinol monooxygenase YgiN [Arthrobacter sp. cf158]
MATTFNVVAQYRTKPGTTENILKHLQNIAAETRKEPGNLSYEFFGGVEDSRSIVILESYQSAEAFELHRQTPHFLNIGAVYVIPELESRSVSTYLNPVEPAEAP